MRTGIVIVAMGTAGLGGCVKQPGDDSGGLGEAGEWGDGSSSGSAGSLEGGSSSSGTSTPDDTGGGEGFPGTPDLPPGCLEGGCDQCQFQVHQPCDDGTDEPFAAMGVGCPGEPQPSTSRSGSSASHGVITNLGASDVFTPREGSTMAVIGTGRIGDLFHETPASDDLVNPLWCNVSLNDYSPGASLPPPLAIEPVAPASCEDDPSLVGGHDCSSTVAEQFEQGGTAHDYADLRLELDVPAGVRGFSFDFAYLTVEYPKYYQTGFNDMFVGWVESESWSGNVSYDEMGNPISLNASFLEYLDDGSDLAEFEGTCMQGHAATGWLTSTFPLVEGEHVEIVFAVFDLQDARLDSYVLLDDFQWLCDGHVDPGTVEG